MTALQSTITMAAQQAAASFQPAVAGSATGTSDVNENRNVIMSDGKYHIGLGGDLPSNKGMTIMVVKSLEFVTTANKLINGFLGNDLSDTTPPLLLRAARLCRAHPQLITPSIARRSP